MGRALQGWGRRDRSAGQGTGRAAVTNTSELPPPARPHLPEAGLPQWAGPARAAGPGLRRRLMRSRPGDGGGDGAAGAAAAQAAVLQPAHRPQPLRAPGPPQCQRQAAGKAEGRAGEAAGAGPRCPGLGCAGSAAGTAPPGTAQPRRGSEPALRAALRASLGLSALGMEGAGPFRAPLAGQSAV